MDAFVYVIIAALGEITKIALTLSAISVPIVCVLKGYGFFKSNLISIPVLFALVILGAYLADAYPLIQLKLMGFDLHGMSHAERMLNVAPPRQDTATALYSTIFGIGWPLKALFAMVFVAPYPAVAWAVTTPITSTIKKACRSH